MLLHRHKTSQGLSHNTTSCSSITRYTASNSNSSNAVTNAYLLSEGQRWQADGLGFFWRVCRSEAKLHDDGGYVEFGFVSGSILSSHDCERPTARRSDSSFPDTRHLLICIRSSIYI